MTFYDNENQENIIEYYKDNKFNFSITYLNGKNQINNNITKEELEQTMIVQATNRDKDLFDKVDWDTKKAILAYTSTFIPMILGIKIQLSLLFYVAFINSLICLYDLNKKNKRLSELKKYRLYLKLKQELDKEENCDITKILELDPYLRKEININTLDRFTYGNMKEIKKELKRRNKNC